MSETELVRAAVDYLLVPLSGLKGSGLCAKVDHEDAEAVLVRKWRLHPGGYAMSSGSRSDTRRHLLMHRMILECPTGMDIDHINGDKLDNRRSNLRAVPHAVNLLNRHSKRRPGVEPGVSVAQGGRWRVRFCIGGKCVYHRETKSLDVANDMAKSKRQEMLAALTGN